jgi:hypothetical protein
MSEEAGASFILSVGVTRRKAAQRIFAVKHPKGFQD